MKKFFITFFLFIVTLTVSAQDIEWISIEKAIEMNKIVPKLILIDVYTDWCGWCKRMDKTTYSNKVIIDYINKNYYAVKLDGEQKEDIVFNNYTFKFKAQGRRGYNEFTAALLNGKLSYPTTVFMNEKVQLLDRVPGYLDATMMEKVIKYFATKKYESTKWEDYIKDFKSDIK